MEVGAIAGRRGKWEERCRGATALRRCVAVSEEHAANSKNPVTKSSQRIMAQLKLPTLRQPRFLLEIATRLAF